jgi:antibiotic biosynthesis monooxygenase (ABM) superfamily enzyme
MNNEDQDTQQQPKQLPFWKQLLSVMQASFGVQNKKNKERDFASGSITGFVVAALLFTLVFVMILVTVVSWVLP